MRLLPGLCLLAVSAGFLAAGDKKLAGEKTSTAEVRVTSLSIRKPLPAKAGVFAFGQGTILELVVSQPGKFIVGIDAKASKLDSFTDDKKTDLNKKKGGVFFGQTGWINEFMTQLSPDGEQCTIQITAGSAPAKGANKILVKGSLIVKCGAEEKTTDAKEIAMKTNEEVNLGDFKVKVINAGQFGGQISVQSADPNLKSAELLDAAGKAIKTGLPFRSTLQSPGGKMRHVLNYFLNGKLDKVSVKVTYFNKINSVSVPLDLRVGLGLD